MHVRVFYLILPDQMFQEPFPVHKDSIKLMKRSPAFASSGPRGEGRGFWWPQLCSWKINSHQSRRSGPVNSIPESLPTPTPAQGPGKCIVNVTELNWGDLVSPFPAANSKEMQKR